VIAALVLCGAIVAVVVRAAPQRAIAQLRVLAAASLTDVLPRIDPGPSYSFSGSDTLAAQIRLGAPADVFASANMTLPDALYAQGLIEKPAAFATNRLVLVVPRSNPAAIGTVFDLRRKRVRLVVGTPTVPIGAYTRRILRNLGLTAVLANVVSEETDVRSILSKVALGEADAGFVYLSDVRSVSGKVAVIGVPAWAQPPVRYGIAVVKSTRDRAAAVAFIDRVLSKSGQAKLRAAGFGAVPHRVTRYEGQ
jgi:molybdate transport system substrate-binding protein